MKLEQKLSLFLLPLSLTFTSCSFFEAFQTGYIQINCSNGGTIKSIIHENEKVSTGTEINLFPVAEDGYKLTSLKVNNKNILNQESFILEKDLNLIEAEFKLIDDIKENYDYVINEQHLTMEDVYKSQGLPVLPNKGDVKCLVVPVNFKEFPAFTNQQLNSLNYTFNGNKLDNTNDYWESVKSFYNKSSYNQLNLDFSICDPIDSGISAADFINKESHSKLSGLGVKTILNNIYSSLSIDGNKVNYKNYDSNSDGYVDGIYLVYNVNDFYKVYTQNQFWAYTFWNIDDAPNLNSPKFGVYANFSQIFLYTESNLGLDAHTIIHETGHMLGLDDYYSYDNLANNASASGGLDMMDLNIGDHNSYSKFALGWIKPKVLSLKNKEVSLNSFTETGDAIIVSQSFENSPFDEYFMIEFYTNTGLNKLDSMHNYGLNRFQNPYNKLFDYNGIKISHIDARLLKYFDNYTSYLNNGTIKILPKYPKYYPVYSVGTSNTSSFSYKHDSSGRYNLYEIITPSNVRTYNNCYLGKNSKNIEVLEGLFKKGDVFSNKNQSNFFIDGKLHNGATFDLNIKIKDITDKNALIVLE